MRNNAVLLVKDLGGGRWLFLYKKNNLTTTLVSCGHNSVA